VTQAQANAQLATDLFALLAAAGVRDVVVSPGARSAPLAFAADATRGLCCHVTLDERVGAFFALGLARGTGLPTVFLCTSGSAGAHALPAVLEARHSRVPLLVVTADRPEELQDCGAAQTISQAQLLAPQATTFLLEAVGPETPAVHLRTRVAQVLDATRFPDAGPVHLNVRLREPLFEASLAATTSTLAPLEIWRDEASPSPSLVREVAARLSGQRGVIVVGPHAPDATLGASVHRLADRLGWPVVAEPGSQARYGHDGPTLISAAGAILRSRRAAAHLAPRVVLRFGAAPTNKHVGAWLARYASGRILAVDPAGTIRDPEHAAAVVVAAPAARLCEALCAAQLAAAPSAWLARWQALETQARRLLDDAAATGFWEGSVAQLAAEHVPLSAAVHLGNSTPVRDAELFAPRHAPRRVVLTSRGTSGIDGGIATVCGEARGLHQPVVAVLGDLALLHDVSGLLAARRLGGDIAVIVIDNGGGGIFRSLPLAEAGAAFERYCLTPTSYDIAGLARVAELAYARCTDAKALVDALEHLPRPCVIHAVVDGAASHEARSRVLASIEATLERALEHYSESVNEHEHEEHSHDP